MDGYERTRLQTSLFDVFNLDPVDSLVRWPGDAKTALAIDVRSGDALRIDLVFLVLTTRGALAGRVPRTYIEAIMGGPRQRTFDRPRAERLFDKEYLQDGGPVERNLDLIIESSSIQTPWRVCYVDIVAETETSSPNPQHKKAVDYIGKTLVQYLKEYMERQQQKQGRDKVEIEVPDLPDKLLKTDSKTTAKDKTIPQLTSRGCVIIYDPQANNGNPAYLVYTGKTGKTIYPDVTVPLPLVGDPETAT